MKEGERFCRTSYRSHRPASASGALRLAPSLAGVAVASSILCISTTLHKSTLLFACLSYNETGSASMPQCLCFIYISGQGGGQKGRFSLACFRSKGTDLTRLSVCQSKETDLTRLSVCQSKATDILTLAAGCDMMFFASGNVSGVCLEWYRSGHNEAVLKTVCPQGRVGSNPTLSVFLCLNRYKE